MYIPAPLSSPYIKKYFFFFFFLSSSSSSTSKAAAVMNDFEAVAGPVAGERDPTAFCSGSHLVWNLLSSIKGPASLYIFLLFLLFILFSLLLLCWAWDVDKCQTIIPRAGMQEQQPAAARPMSICPTLSFLLFPFQSLASR